tara:strand:- start:2584 stop:2796 length:213 start_codon:yes stop_codon:yes gene_type:complete
MKKYLFYIVTLYILLNTDAYAYLDPGSGSMILQAILGFIAAALATVSYYWEKVKTFLSKLFRKKKNSEKD